MMIWINGAFGAGKTTLAEELHRRVDAQALHEDNPEADASARTSGIVTWSAARRPGLSFPVAH
jgi:adenylate kinase family enzyme